MSAKIPDWKLERFALGELPSEELAAVQAALAADSSLEARLAALRADNEALLAAHPPAEVAHLIETRAASGRKAAASLSRFSLLLVPVVAALLLVVVGREPAGDAGDAAPLLEPTRTKGLEPHLSVHRKRGDSFELLLEGAPARAGDVLQLSYVAAARAHGVILSLDGRGTVTLHFPASATASTALAREPMVALPSAYELDDAPLFERFVFITSAAPLDVQAVLAAARAVAADAAKAASAPLPLGDAVEQQSTIMRKIP